MADKCPIENKKCELIKKFWESKGYKVFVRFSPNNFNNFIVTFIGRAPGGLELKVISSQLEVVGTMSYFRMTTKQKIEYYVRGIFNGALSYKWLFECVVTFLSTLILMTFAWCWIDVVVHNMEPGAYDRISPLTRGVYNLMQMMQGWL